MFDKSHAVVVRNEELKIHESMLVEHLRIFDIIPESLGIHVVHAQCAFFFN